jgi:hypothetical protein
MREYVWRKRCVRKDISHSHRAQSGPTIPKYHQFRTYSLYRSAHSSATHDLGERYESSAWLVFGEERGTDNLSFTWDAVRWSLVRCEKLLSWKALCCRHVLTQPSSSSLLLMCIQPLVYTHSAQLTLLLGVTLLVLLVVVLTPLASRCPAFSTAPHSRKRPAA